MAQLLHDEPAMGQLREVTSTFSFAGTLNKHVGSPIVGWLVGQASCSRPCAASSPTAPLHMTLSFASSAKAASLQSPSEGIPSFL